ncbi:MAG: hypothetical protein HY094_08135 [Candidatus Melainabacteria bacterium]|nr:hypothetical protein [Candidatus Melainabacteria bacterium]
MDDLAIKGPKSTGSQAASFVMCPTKRHGETQLQRQTEGSNIATIDKTKEILNCVTNGGAAALNLLTFISGNLPILGSLKEKLESASDFMTKIAVATQGIILSIDTWKKRNLVPFIGYVLELPTALLSSGDELWFNRGLAQGLGQFQGIIDRLQVLDNGKLAFDQKGEPLYIGGDFSKKNNKWWEGWVTSLTTTAKAIPRLTSELINNPSSFFNMSHSLFVASSGQIVGTFLGMLGLRTFGAIIRDIFGTFVDFGLIRDKKGQDKSKNNLLNFNSLFVWGGLTWILAAVVDIYKRIPILSGGINCLTNLSLTSDRGASLLYTLENLRISRSKDNIN